MKVVKIMVDKKPEKCSLCWYFDWKRNGYTNRYWCNAKQNIHAIVDITMRPSWCPLETEEFCEWVLNYHIDNAVWDIAPSCCVGEFSMNKPNYEICPNCGKRIKYEEVE